MHVIVSDGPDYALCEILPDLLELPAHAGGLGAAARNYGVEHTESELIAFLDDDNAFRPNHLGLLVGLLDANPDADFAYGRMEYSNGQTSIGAYPPALGQIDASSFVCRRKTMELGMWAADHRLRAGLGNDRRLDRQGRAISLHPRNHARLPLRLTQ